MSNITHAGSPLVIDGVEYEASPLTLEDLEYLDTWICSRVIEAARMSLPEDATQEQRKETLLAASEAATQLSLFDGGGLGQLMKPIGLSSLLMRLLRRKQPAVTAAQCFSWMIRQDLRSELQTKMIAMFRSAIGMKEHEEKAGSDPTPVPPTVNGSHSIGDSSSGSSSQSESLPAKSAI